MERMGNPEFAPVEHFVYRQYRSWSEDERWELIDGLAWSMSPAPLRQHQKLSHNLALLFGNHLKHRKCEVYEAPFDVLLPDGDEADDEVSTVIQPDLVVFCDKSKLTLRGARGAPDLIVEILSPSTQKKDLNEKFKLYERHGVREYWIVDPGNRTIQVWHLESDGTYDKGELRDAPRDYSAMSSRVLEGFSIDPKELFADMD